MTGVQTCALPIYENAIRQIVERVTVLSADEILVRIKGGAEIKQRLEGK